MQTRHVILTFTMDQLTLMTSFDHQRNSAALPLLPPLPAQRRRQEQRGRASLVICIHYAGRQATLARSTDAGDNVSASAVSVLLARLC